MISDAGGYVAAGATLGGRGVTSGLGLCRLCLPTTTPHVLIFAAPQPYCAVICFLDFLFDFISQGSIIHSQRENVLDPNNVKALT